MRKKIVALSLALCISCMGLSAASSGGLTGLGFFGSLGGSTLGSTGGGLGLSLKFGSFPVLGLQYNMSGDGRLAVSCDYYAIDAMPLGGLFSFYLGAGAFGGLTFGSPLEADIGLRVPVGLQFWPVNKLELFIAAVPYFRLIPSITPYVGGELGLRIHF